VSSIRQGEFNVLALHGRGVSLVCVMAGRENELLLDDMSNVLKEIDSKFGQAIKEWNGEVKELAGTDALINSLFESGKYDGIDWSRDDPKAKQSNTFENVTLGLTRLSRERPVLLFVDDLQWADPSTLTMLHYLARNTRSSRVAVIGSYRPEDITGSWEGRTHQLAETMQLMGREGLFERLELHNLGQEAVLAIIKNNIGRIEEEGFGELVWKETEGNPLFVLELLNLLKDERVLVKKGERWELTKELSNIDVPSKIHDVIERRLSRLIKEQRQLLESASVIGDMFSSDVLSKVSEVKKLDLLKMLNEIEKTHRLIVSMQKRYAFSHVKIREVLYQDLSEELRREYHRIVGDTLSELYCDSDDAVADIGYHYYMAGDAGSAIPRLLRAVEIASAKYSNGEAIRYCKYALELMSGDAWREERLRTTEKLGDIQDIAGSYDEELGSFLRALELAEDDATRARLHRKVGSIHYKKGEYARAIDEYAKGISLLKGERNVEYSRIVSLMGTVHRSRGEYDTGLAMQEEALAILSKCENAEKDEINTLNAIATIHTQRGDYDKALEVFAKARLIAERMGDQRQIGMISGNTGVVYMERGEPDKALEHYQKNLLISERIGDLKVIAMMYNNIGNVLKGKAEYDRSLSMHEKSLRMKERLGEQMGIAISYTNIGNIHKERGEYGKALDYYERCVSLCEKLGEQRGAALSYGNQAVVYYEKGELDKALEIHEKGFKIRERIGDKSGIALSHIETADVLTEKGDADKALARYAEGLKMAEILGNKLLQCKALTGMGESYLAKGSTDEAEASASKALELASQSGSKRLEAIAMRVLASVLDERGDPVQASQRFEEAISLSKGTCSKWECAMLFYVYGSSLKRIGDDATAIGMLQRALDLFGEMKLPLRVEMVIKALGR
jgi:predicted ATPase